MKQAFLDSLVGVEVSEAETMVLTEGHMPYTIPEQCMAVTAIARGNTVVLWQKDGKVKSAEAGDPLELEKGDLQ